MAIIDHGSLISATIDAIRVITFTVTRTGLSHQPTCLIWSPGNFNDELL